MSKEFVVMKKIIPIAIIIISFSTAFFNCTVQDANYEMLQDSLSQYLLPYPQKIVFKKDHFQITDSTRIIYNDSESAVLKFTVDRFLKLLKNDKNYLFKISIDSSIQGFSVYILNDLKVTENLLKPLVDMKNLGDQGYHLGIEKNGINVKANTKRGLFWGMMTLNQIFAGPIVKNGMIPCMQIDDKPHYTWRGFQIDAARAPFSVASIRRVIRVCSAFKLNLLLYREGDDELNAVKYDNLPIGHKNPEALTMAQIKELIDYADKYCIDFIPEIESLGHVAAKALHYPELIEGGFQEEYWENFSHRRKANFKVGEPGTYKLLESIFNEWFAVLRTPMVHLGLDEVRLPMDKQAEHLKKLLSVADKVGEQHRKEFKYLMWSDAPPHPKQYDQQVIRCLWSYGDGGDVSFENKHLIEQGINELSAAGNKQRVFMAGGSGSKHFPYVFDGPDLAFKNLAQWAMWGRNKPNFQGMYAVQWHGNMIDLWFPNYLMAADFGWKPPDEIPNIKQGLERVQMHIKSILDVEGTKSNEINRPAWDGIWLDGKKWGQDIITGIIAKSNDERWKEILHQYLQPIPEEIKFTGEYFQITPETRIHYNHETFDKSVLPSSLGNLKLKESDDEFPMIASETVEAYSIYLTNIDVIDETLSKFNIHFEESSGQNYVILIAENGIKVTADNRQSFMLGITTLKQVLRSPFVKYKAIPGIMLSGK